MAEKMIEWDDYEKHQRSIHHKPDKDDYEIAKSDMQKLLSRPNIYEIEDYSIFNFEIYKLQCQTYCFGMNYINNIKTLSQVQYTLLYGLFPKTILRNVELDGDLVRDIFKPKSGHLALRKLPTDNDPSPYRVKTDTLDDYSFIKQVTKNLIKDKFDDKLMTFVRVGTNTELAFNNICCPGVQLVKNLEKYTVVVVDWDEFYDSIESPTWTEDGYFGDNVQLRSDFRIAFIFSTRFSGQTCCVWLDIALPLKAETLHRPENMAIWYFVCTPVYDKPAPEELYCKPVKEEYDDWNYDVFGDIFCCINQYYNYIDTLICRPEDERMDNEEFRLEFADNSSSCYEIRVCAQEKPEEFINLWKRRIHYILCDYDRFSPIRFNVGSCIYGLLKNDPSVLLTEEYYKIITHGRGRGAFLPVPRKLFVHTYK